MDTPFEQTSLPNGWHKWDSLINSVPANFIFFITIYQKTSLLAIE